MKKIKIIFTFMLLFILASCGYKLANKPVPTSKSREYPKKINYFIAEKEVEMKGDNIKEKEEAPKQSSKKV